MPARFYLTPAQWSQNTLRGEEAKHAIRVLRLKKGAEIELFNGLGRIGRAEITAIENKELQFKYLQESESPSPHPKLHLYQSVPKGKNMEFIIQKAVELGVNTIQPIITQNTVAISEAPERKLLKWRKTALEACKQCKQPFLPIIEEPKRLMALEDKQECLKIVGALAPHAKSLSETIRLSQSPQAMAVCIGPEGDFTAQELSHLEGLSFTPVSLGSLVLRVETATLFSLSALRCFYS